MKSQDLTGSFPPPAPRAGRGVLGRVTNLFRPGSGTSISPRATILWRPSSGSRVVHRMTPVVAVTQSVLRGTRRHVRETPGAFGFLIGHVEKARLGGRCTILEGWWEVPEGDLRTANVHEFRAAWAEAGAYAARQRMELAGWYHGHGLLGCTLSDRGVGCTLSERDIALHRSFFRHDWQCSLVIIPHERFPAGAFVQGDPGNRHQAASPVPFLELLDGGPDPATGSIASYVDWTNYTRDRALNEAGGVIRRIKVVTPTDEDAAQAPPPSTPIEREERPLRTFQLGSVRDYLPKEFKESATASIATPEPSTSAVTPDVDTSPEKEVRLQFDPDSLIGGLPSSPHGTGTSEPGDAVQIPSAAEPGGETAPATDAPVSAAEPPGEAQAQPAASPANPVIPEAETSPSEPPTPALTVAGSATGPGTASDSSDPIGSHWTVTEAPWACASLLNLGFTTRQLLAAPRPSARALLAACPTAEQAVAASALPGSATVILAPPVPGADAGPENEAFSLFPVTDSAAQAETDVAAAIELPFPADARPEQEAEAQDTETPESDLEAAPAASVDAMHEEGDTVKEVRPPEALPEVQAAEATETVVRPESVEDREPPTWEEDAWTDAVEASHAWLDAVMDAEQEMGHAPPTVVDPLEPPAPVDGRTSADAGSVDDPPTQAIRVKTEAGTDGEDGSTSVVEASSPTSADPLNDWISAALGEDIDAAVGSSGSPTPPVPTAAADPAEPESAPQAPVSQSAGLSSASQAPDAEEPTAPAADVLLETAANGSHPQADDPAVSDPAHAAHPGAADAAHTAATGVGNGAIPPNGRQDHGGGHGGWNGDGAPQSGHPASPWGHPARRPGGNGDGGAAAYMHMAAGRRLPPYPVYQPPTYTDGLGWPAPYGQQPPGGEDTGNADLASYWRIIRDRYKTVLAIFLPIFLGVTLASLLQTPMFRASGTIEIRKQGGEVMPIEALLQPGRVSTEYLETQYGILESRSLVRRVVRDLGFVVKDEPEVATPAEMVEATESEVDAFGGRLLIDPSRGSRLVDIFFEHESPDVAAAAVNGVIAAYIDMRVEAGREAGDRLALQVDSVRARLADSEAELQAYMREHDLVMVTTGDGDASNLVTQRLEALQDQITEAEADRYQKESRYNLIQRGEYGLLDSNVLQQLNIRISDLQSEYARLRSTFTDNYPRTRQVKNQLDELQSQFNRERGRIASEIRNDYEAAVQRQELLTGAFEEQRALMDRLADASAEYNRLRQDVEANQNLYSTLQQHRQEAGVSAALASNDIDIVDLALPPSGPYKPTPKRSAALALIMGLVLGIGGAFLRELLDNSVRTVEEVGTLVDVPVLAAIPSARVAEERRLSGSRVGNLAAGPIDALRRARRDQEDRPAEPGWYRIDRDNARQSALSEAFGGLRTSVLVSRPEGPPQVMLLTSAQPREGKTTVTVNLSLSLSRLGRRVLLIDADTRRPAIHRALAIDGTPGLVDFLVGRGPWRTLVKRDIAPGLDVLVAGAPPDSPSEMLASPAMAALIHEARADYDFVIVDSPALLVNVPDTRIIAPLADGVVLVMRSGVTPREAARRMLQEIPNPIGVVLNDLSSDHLPGYYRMEEEQSAV